MRQETELSKRLRDFMAQKGFVGKGSQKRFVDFLGISRSTVEDMLYGECKNPTPRIAAALREKIPGIFSENFQVPEPSNSGEKFLPKTAAGKSGIKLNLPGQLSVYFKTMLVEHCIQSLRPVLEWFVFQATSAERSLFRETLGLQWPWFQSLVRALTGEAALLAVMQDGELNPERRPQ